MIDEMRVFLRLLEATAARPLGLLALMAFVGSTLAYLLMRGVNPRVSGRLMWVVFASLAAVAFSVSDTQKRTPALRAPAVTSAWVPAPSASGGSRTSSTTGTALGQGGTGATSGGAGAAGAAAGARGPSATSSASRGEPTSSGTGGAGTPGARGTTPTGTVAGGRGATPSAGTAGPGGVADASGAAGGSTGAGGAAAGATGGNGSPSGSPTAGPAAPEPPREQITLINPTVSRELATRDHRCPDPAAGIITCEGNPTRTTYRLTLEAPPSERLTDPELRCVSGPCAFSSVLFTRLAPDGRTVEAAFDVWDAPTRWRLSATRDFSRAR